ncbi:MAG: ribonuclease P protein component [Dehalococcoidia bacterium]
MQREQRLRRERDFTAVYQRGRSWSNRLLAVRTLPAAQPQSRFGFAVGKRVGGAVIRNRVKRRLRELVRGLEPAPGWDVVIVARPDAAAADFDQLRSALSSLFGRAGLLATRADGNGGSTRRREENRTDRSKRETIGSSRNEDARS